MKAARGAAAAALAVALAGCAGAPAGATPEPPLAAYFDCLRVNAATLVSGHRGAYAEGLPENAMRTFAAAVEDGLVLLETDIRRLADGTLVLMHDETLERTTTGEGAVADLTLPAFKAVRLEDVAGQAIDEPPPTLAEALAWSEGKAVLQLDVKRGVPFAPVVEAVRAARAQDRVIVITYTPEAAIEVHRLAPELMISSSIDDLTDLDRLTEGGVDPARLLAWTGTRAPDPALWAALRARGVEPMFGALGGRDSLDARFAAAGNDAAYARLVEDGALAVLGSDRARAANAALAAANLGQSRAAACDLSAALE